MWQSVSRRLWKDCTHSDGFVSQCSPSGELPRCLYPIPWCFRIWLIWPHRGNLCISISQSALHPPYKDVITPLRKSRWDTGLPWTGVNCKLQRWFGKKSDQWERLGCSNPSQKDWGMVATPGPLSQAGCSICCFPAHLNVTGLILLPHLHFTDIAQKRWDPESEWNVSLCYGTKHCQALTLILKNHYSTIHTCWYDGAIPVVCSRSLPKSPMGADLFQKQSTKYNNWNAELFHQEARTLEVQFAVVQLLGNVRLFATSRTAACQAFLSFTIFRVFSNSSPLSHWCYLTVLSSAGPFPGDCLPTPILHWRRVMGIWLWRTSRARDHALTYGRADRSALWKGNFLQLILSASRLYELATDSVCWIIWERKKEKGRDNKK